MSRPVGTPIQSRMDLADDELVVWRYQREVDDAWLYQEDRYALDYFDGENGSEPEQVIVKRDWYETLPEDPGS